MAQYYDDDDELEDTAYPEVREILSREYQDLYDDEIEDLVEQYLNGISAEALESWLSNAFRTVAPIAQRALPGAIQGATTGFMAGGPIGGLLGAVAGGAMSAAQPAPRSRAPAPQARPAAVPPRPRTITAPTQVPRQSIPAPTMQPTSGAAAQLASLLQRPEIIQALAALMMRSAGAREVYVENKSVPVSAVANMLSVYANRAATEFRESSPGAEDSVPEYLFGDQGELLCDPVSPDGRASALAELFNRAEVNDMIRDATYYDRAEDEFAPVDFYEDELDGYSGDFYFEDDVDEYAEHY